MSTIQDSWWHHPDSNGLGQPWALGTGLHEARTPVSCMSEKLVPREQWLTSSSAVSTRPSLASSTTQRPCVPGQWALLPRKLFLIRKPLQGYSLIKNFLSNEFSLIHTKALGGEALALSRSFLLSLCRGQGLSSVAFISLSTVAPSPPLPCSQL